MVVEKLLHLLVLMAALLGFGHAKVDRELQSKVYVPSAQNKYVPKPSCATLFFAGDWKALCATTHGFIVRGDNTSEAAAAKVADAIYDRELANQGGQLFK
jgi:hypothetical protein